MGQPAAAAKTTATTDATPPEPFTCEWAKQGLAKALEGLAAAGKGATGYGIGTRWVRFNTTAEQVKAVDYWNQMVKQYCGEGELPPALTGRDAACRIVPRDL